MKGKLKKLAFCNTRRMNNPKFVIQALAQYFGMSPKRIANNPIYFRIAILSLAMLCDISADDIAVLLNCSVQKVEDVYANTYPPIVIGFMYSIELQGISDLAKEIANKYRNSLFAGKRGKVMDAIVIIIQSVADGFWCTEGAITNNVDDTAFLDERAAIVLLSKGMSKDAKQLLSEILNISPACMPEVVKELEARAKTDKELAGKIATAKSVLLSKKKTDEL